MYTQYTYVYCLEVINEGPVIVEKGNLKLAYELLPLVHSAWLTARWTVDHLIQWFSAARHELGSTEGPRLSRKISAQRPGWETESRQQWKNDHS